MQGGSTTLISAHHRWYGTLISAHLMGEKVL